MRSLKLVAYHKVLAKKNYLITTFFKKNTLLILGKKKRVTNYFIRFLQIFIVVNDH